MYLKVKFLLVFVSLTLIFFSVYWLFYTNCQFFLCLTKFTNSFKNFEIRVEIYKKKFAYLPMLTKSVVIVLIWVKCIFIIKTKLENIDIILNNDI